MICTLNQSGGKSSPNPLRRMRLAARVCNELCLSDFSQPIQVDLLTSSVRPRICLTPASLYRRSAAARRIASDKLRCPRTQSSDSPICQTSDRCRSVIPRQAYGPTRSWAWPCRCARAMLYLSSLSLSLSLSSRVCLRVPWKLGMALPMRARACACACVYVCMCIPHPQPRRQPADQLSARGPVSPGAAHGIQCARGTARRHSRAPRRLPGLWANKVYHTCFQYYYYYYKLLLYCINIVNNIM